MTLAKVVIDQQYASLDIKITPAKMSLQTNARHIVNNNTTDTKISSISGMDAPAFELDFSALMSDIGVKDPKEFQQSFTAKSQAAASETIANTVSDGHAMAATQNNGNVIPQLAKQHSVRKEPEFEFTNIPSKPAQLTWQNQQLDINWGGKSVSLEWSDDYMPKVTVDPRATVEVALRNQPKLTITVTGWPPEVGAFVDEAA